MARRRGFRRNRRGGFRGFLKRGRGKRGSSRDTAMSLVLPAMIYGAGRSYLANLAAPLTSKVPLGNYADEVVFGVAGWYLAKKNPMGLGKIGKAMLIVEAASIGNQVVSGVTGGSGFSSGVTFYS